MDTQLPLYSLEQPYNSDGDVQPGQPGPNPADNRVEHKYFLKTEKSEGETWATLKLASGARSSSAIPLFYEGDEIEGSLNLYLEKGDPIQDITIWVLGEFSL